MKRLVILACLALAGPLWAADPPADDSKAKAAADAKAETNAKATSDSKDAAQAKAIAEKKASLAKAPICPQSTGSRIKRPDNDCVPVPGRSYTRDDLERTGAVDTSEALRRLDPALR